MRIAQVLEWNVKLAIDHVINFADFGFGVLLNAFSRFDDEISIWSTWLIDGNTHKSIIHIKAFDFDIFSCVEVIQVLSKFYIFVVDFSCSIFKLIKGFFKSASRSFGLLAVEANFSSSIEIIFNSLTTSYISSEIDFLDQGHSLFGKFQLLHLVLDFLNSSIEHSTILALQDPDFLYDWPHFI